MTSLGERLTAMRDKPQEAADAACETSKAWAAAYADAIRAALKTYIDSQVTAAKATAKTYVDNQIAKLVAANNLNPPQ